VSTDEQQETADGRPSGGGADTSGIEAPATPAVVPGVSRELTSLKSLAPAYVEEQHKTYLDRLEAAVKDDKNLNIALSGPYGTGKSSVLDEFQKKHKSETVRLAISTLAPAGEQTSLTNRIQKELVKQLLYGAKPTTQRNSRFSPISPVSKTQAALEGIGLVVAVWVLLKFLGHLPEVAGTGKDHSGLQRTGAWLLFGAVIAVAFAVLRVYIFNRFVISGMSAAGASVTLSKRTNTYFDEYLDEIVYFFDEEPKNIVILEDLDRFNDPHIFEALRELNTLLNSTAKRRKTGKPLRFVYAMRDSLFEKLGNDTNQERKKGATRRKRRTSVPTGRSSSTSSSRSCRSSPTAPHAIC
jgi:Cdc6-like AAA superfamily ATPase